MITISWGLNDYTESIEQALNDASKNGVLIFAAASNYGRNKKDISFPARLDDVFCIGAANHLGITADFTPRPAPTMGFSVLGLGVRGSYRSTSNDPVQKGASEIPFSARRMNGTSFATPIAAGIVVNLLECLREKKMCNREDPTIKTQIYNVLCHISGRHVARDYHYLVPWEAVVGNKERNFFGVMRDVIRRLPGLCLAVRDVNISERLN
jgi:hypothetical protein